MSFLEGYSKKALGRALLKFGLYTVGVYAFMRTLIWYDQQNTGNDLLIGILLIPVGLVLFILIILAMNNRKTFDWYRLTYLLFVLLNFMIYLTMTMYIASHMGNKYFE